MSSRRTAAERREEIVEIALRHFARGGFAGTGTVAIAREAGISQPYLFRLFRTKRELFLACMDVNTDRIRRTFEDAARGLPREERLPAMGKAYVELLQDRDSLLMQLQGYATVADPAIREHARRRYEDVVAAVRALSGAGETEVWTFIAHGMLLNVVAALELHVHQEQVTASSTSWSDPAGLLGYDGESAA